MQSQHPESEHPPQIKPTSMGPVQRVVLGIVCALVSIGIFFVILMILERFKQNAPAWRRDRQQGSQVHRAAGKAGIRRAPKKR